MLFILIESCGRLHQIWHHVLQTLAAFDIEMRARTQRKRAQARVSHLGKSAEVVKQIARETYAIHTRGKMERKLQIKTRDHGIRLVS